VAEYLELNRANWDERVPAHVASADYAVQRFLDNPAFLSDVVRFDQPLLGDVSGLHGVHLQCHIGTDTVSLARLGALMTGLDFSGPAVAEAARLATATGADASFVQADVYDALLAVNAVTAILDARPAGGTASARRPRMRRRAKSNEKPPRHVKGATSTAN
jgi:hypothetical protein